jgi:hypothetical protein
VELVDGYGNIVVPPAVRSIINAKEPPFGGKKRANKQYSCGSIHIRDYNTHYTVHMDIVDPLSSPLRHLLMDVPEYLAGATATFIVGGRLSATAYNICKKEGKSTKDAVIAAILAGHIANSTTRNLVFKTATSSLEKKRSE